MIRSLPNILTRIAGRQVPAPAVRRANANVARAATASADFQSILRSSTAPAAAPAAATAIAPAAASPVPRLGPFTGDPNTKPAVPTPNPVAMPAAPYTPLPASQQNLIHQPWDPFNKSQHEAYMNNWLMQVTQNANQQKLQIYQHALDDWKLNDARCRDLGMAPPPLPTPPALEAVGPMPDGYWFGTHA